MINQLLSKLLFNHIVKCEGSILYLNPDKKNWFRHNNIDIENTLIIYVFKNLIVNQIICFIFDLIFYKKTKIIKFIISQNSFKILPKILFFFPPSSSGGFSFCLTTVFRNCTSAEM